MKKKEESAIGQSQNKINNFLSFIEKFDPSINFDGIQLEATDTHYCFFSESVCNSHIKNFKKFVQRRLLPDSPITKITLSQFISNQLVNISDNFSKMIIASLFQPPLVHFLTEISYRPDGKIYINLPLQAATLLSSQTFKVLSVKENQLVIDLLKSDYPLLLIEQDLIPNHEGDFFFILQADILKEKIYYRVKELPNYQVEVLPYFYIPQQIESPLFHFVIDKSSSMVNHLPQLEVILLKLITHLFLEKPHAKVKITFFDHQQYVSEYTADQLSLIEEDFKRHSADGSTALYATTRDILEASRDLKQSINILLFTSSKEETGMPSSALEANFIRHFSDVDRAHIKLLLISYNTQQPLILENLTNVFDGALIYTDDVDFISAFEAKPSLKDWIAQRKLFTQEVIVSNSIGSTTQCSFSKHSLNLGSFIALKPNVISKEDKLVITIYDDQNFVVAEDNYKYQEPPQSPRKLSVFEKGLGRVESDTDTDTDTLTEGFTII